MCETSPTVQPQKEQNPALVITVGVIVRLIVRQLESKESNDRRETWSCRRTNKLSGLQSDVSKHATLPVQLNTLNTYNNKVSGRATELAKGCLHSTGSRLKSRR